MEGVFLRGGVFTGEEIKYAVENMEITGFMSKGECVQLRHKHRIFHLQNVSKGHNLVPLNFSKILCVLLIKQRPFLTSKVAFMGLLFW